MENVVNRGRFRGKNPEIPRKMWALLIWVQLCGTIVTTSVQTWMWPVVMSDGFWVVL